MIATSEIAGGRSCTGQSVLVRSYPRLHVGLLDLGHVTARRHGGAGFTVDGPALEVTAEPLPKGSGTEVAGLERVDARTRAEADDALAAFTRRVGPLDHRFTVRGGPPQHVGLGSKTLLLLTLLRSAASLVEYPPGIGELQLMSGRGGTSGIGVNAFFQGGFLTDGGHASHASKPFGPSSADRPDEVPPVLCRLPVPESWRFSLIVPRAGRIADAFERRVFEDNTPLPAAEVHEAISATYHGVVPAVALADLELLGTSLATLHEVGFKRRELDLQAPQVRDLYLRIRDDLRVPVGLSSMGPLLYVVSTAAETDLHAALERLAGEHGCDHLGTRRPRNAGHDVIPWQPPVD